MSGLAFLLIVVVVTVVGSLIVWLRHRKPTHFMSSVDDFQREMQALGKPPGSNGGGRGRTRRPTKAAPPATAPLPRATRSTADRPPPAVDNDQDGGR